MGLMLMSIWNDTINSDFLCDDKLLLFFTKNFEWFFIKMNKLIKFERQFWWLQDDLSWVYVQIKQK